MSNPFSFLTTYFFASYKFYLSSPLALPWLWR